MKILVEITHPAHVHFFRNAVSLLEKKGHTIAVTARRKDVTIELLNNFNIPFTLLSSLGKSKFALVKELAVRDFRLWNFCRKFKPDILTGISGVFAAHVGFLLRKPVVVWDDTEIATLAHKIAYPFVTAVYCPDCYYKKLGKKQKFYAGCHELAYLHPNRFSPDPQLVRSLGIDTSQKYCIIRFVSWQAHHDIGQSGITDTEKIELVKRISAYARPYITSEKPLPAELEEFRLSIPVHQIHHLMAFASLCVTEGATMASESGILGVPTIYINPLKAGTINEQAEYGLLSQITEYQKILETSTAYLNDTTAKEKAKANRERFISNKIDVTAFIVDTLEKTASIYLT
jgi:predicted glycosyltransferase